MEYPVKDIETEFFKRTFELVEKYKDFEHETTFLINCLYGIIIVANVKKLRNKRLISEFKKFFSLFWRY